MKSGNLNFLEPSGPLQACNGTALPFIFLLLDDYILGIHATPVIEPSNKKFESHTCLHNEGEKFAYLTTGFHM